MNVSNLLSHDPAQRAQPLEKDEFPSRKGYTTPSSNNSHHGSQASTPNSYHLSPHSNAIPKYVTFELLFSDSPNYRGRLPMRVNIFPHDTTDSIVTTVKNFYGLYESQGERQGVSFEDEQGNTLIARYENFSPQMTVYVRVLPDTEDSTAYQAQRLSSTPVEVVNGFAQMRNEHPMPPHPAQALTYGQPPSRPDSRCARMRSISPHSGRGRRSVSANSKIQSKVARSRSGIKSRGSSTHGSVLDQPTDSAVLYSSDDGDHGSTTSSRKAKSEQLASAEISVDNIVKGNRRKRAKFESSELPLFVPTQIPLTASVSSMSPTRQPLGYQVQPPLNHNVQASYAWNHSLPSPQSLNSTSGAVGYGSHAPFRAPAAPIDRRLRDRASTYPSSGANINRTMEPISRSGVLPTPDPTIASTISDEDVALQLMRLGEASMMSSTTRNSASTLDDALSGVADAQSSDSETSASDDDDGIKEEISGIGPLRHDMSSTMAGSATNNYARKLDVILPSLESTDSSDRYGDDDLKDKTFVASPSAKNGITPRSDRAAEPKRKGEKSKLNANGYSKPRSVLSTKSTKITKPKPAGSSKAKGKAVVGLGAQSLTSSGFSGPSRNPSWTSTVNFQQSLKEDEEDLSSKPRCQRCRKSKKGCDRQRPCQRCKDAGLGMDDCISEDEGNGRKGRYGRHMGVIVKKQPADSSQSPVVAEPVSANGSVAGDPIAVPGSKKRKRTTT